MAYKNAVCVQIVRCRERGARNPTVRGFHRDTSWKPGEQRGTGKSQERQRFLGTIRVGRRNHARSLPRLAHRTPDTGHRTPDIGHRTSDTGHRTSDIGHRTSHIGHRTSDIGHRYNQGLPMHVTAIIAAAGSGRRLGSAKPKQMLDIGGGTMLQHSVRAFLAHPRVTEIIVVVPAGRGRCAGRVDAHAHAAAAGRRRRRAAAGFRGQRLRSRRARRRTSS